MFVHVRVARAREGVADGHRPDGHRPRARRREPRWGGWSATVRIPRRGIHLRVHRGELRGVTLTVSAQGVADQNPHAGHRFGGDQRLVATESAPKGNGRRRFFARRSSRPVPVGVPSHRAARAGSVRHVGPRRSVRYGAHGVPALDARIRVLRRGRLRRVCCPVVWVPRSRRVPRVRLERVVITESLLGVNIDANRS